MVEERKIPKGYKQTEVGVIPEDWEIKRLGEIVQIFNGGTPSTSNSSYWGGDIKWCTPTDITSNKSKYLSETAKQITELGLSKSSARLLPIGTLLFCSRATIGEVKIARSEISTNQGFKSMVTLAGICNEWLYYSLIKNKIRFIEKAIGSTFLEISKNAIVDINIVVPSYTEQKIIANVLCDTDNMIQSHEKLINKKKKIKQGAMQELLTGKKRLPGFSGEWKVKKLGDIAVITKGQLITENDAQHGAIPVIAGGKKPSYFHSVANRLGKTITVSASGANAGYVGFHKNPIFASDCSTISEGNGYSIEFIYYQLLMLQETIYYAQTGGAQPHIHPKDIRPLLINYTDFQEQRAIAQVLSDMDTEIEALEEKLEKYKTIKQGMMQELLTGRTRLI